MGVLRKTLRPMNTAALLTYPEAAARLGVSPKTLRRIVEDGAIPTVRPTDHTVRFDPEDVDAFIASRKTDAVATVATGPADERYVVEQ
jgi:excisionase family DNA binding protein